MTQLSNEEIDRLILDKIMGWTVEEEETYWPNTERVVRDSEGYRVRDLHDWRPSERIEDAWRALEKFPVPKFYVRLVTTVTGNWRCDIDMNGGDGPNVSAFDRSAAKAISLACLKAVGIAVDN